jgi:hypothetical protein
MTDMAIIICAFVLGCAVYGFAVHVLDVILGRVK